MSTLRTAGTNRHLFAYLDELQQKLSAARHIFLFLDYDGTLVKIAPAPQEALPSRLLTETLLSLCRRPRYRVAIVSGRALEEIKALAGVRGIIYVGNHGFEISGPGVSFVHPEAGLLLPHMDSMCRHLRRNLKPFQGVIVECKGLTASVHYRHVAAVDVPRVQAAFDRVIHSLGTDFRVTTGKKVLEVRPAVDWHKGSAILWLLERFQGQHTLPIYVGDDTTDEDAFAVLADGVTVHVGPVDRKSTQARYFLRNPREVRRFLSCLPE